MNKMKPGKARPLKMSASMKTLSLILLTAIVAVSPAVLSGCGGGGVTYQSAGDKTLGQELQDLQASYDKGIITKKEYDETKKKLIKKYTQ
jgi:hypothetical protein